MKVTVSLFQKSTASLLLAVLLCGGMTASVSASSLQAAVHRNSHSYHNQTVVTPPLPAQPVVAQSSLQTAKSTVSGDNGTVKVHRSGTSVNDRRDEPKVCAFYLDAFQFDGLQAVNWHIVQHTHGQTVLSGAVTLDSTGNGHTATYQLPDGMYKLYWNFAGEHGAAKHKVFKVECQPTPAGQPSQPTSPVEPGRGGDLPAPSSGHVLAASTNKPSVAGELVDTGTPTIVSSIIASLMLVSALAIARLPKQQPSFEEIAL